MSHDPRTDVVVDQYERWRYPEPIQDLPGWLQHNWQWFDPSHAHPVLWPNRGYQPGLQILIAGCGTNQAATIAYTNPGATVVGIDVSEPSLDHERLLQDRYGLRNLDLHLLPIEEVASLGREFDLVISTGVLHHLADPQAGMDALASVLRPDGVLALMLYARNGRIGVDMLASVFADMGLRQDEASLVLVREALAALPAHHPLHSYLAIAPDLDFDAGLIDTFLHGRERSYTVQECLALVDRSGLVFQDWFLRSPYEPSAGENAFLAAVAALPDRERWSVMERVNTQNGCHFFLACRADRPTGYRIDLDGPEVIETVPVLRHGCGVDGIDGIDVIAPGWRFALASPFLDLVRAIDGRRTLRELAGEATLADEDAIALIRMLRNRDVVALRITAQE